MADTRDIAAVAAAVRTQPGHSGRSYDITGGEALSYADVADRVAASLGRHVEYVDVPDGAVHDALISVGVNAWFAGALVDLYRDYRLAGPEGYAAMVTDTVARLTGHDPRGLTSLLNEREAPA